MVAGVLIHGDPKLPDQQGMPHPQILYALVVPASDEIDPVLHAMSCAAHAEATSRGDVRAAETVYSTTYDELLDYAMHRYGDEGQGRWITCRVCGSIPDDDLHA